MLSHSEQKAVIWASAKQTPAPNKYWPDKYWPDRY